jgi:hypothetical protein
MARLGAVLGSILAEFARARLISDQLSKNLVAEYRADPILASMSVPRVVVDEAALTLRFSVSEIEEIPEATLRPDDVRAGWLRHVSTSVLTRVVDESDIPADARAAALAALSESMSSRNRTTLGISDVRRAIAGDVRPTVAATTRTLVDAWDKLPASARRSLRTKTNLRLRLERELQVELPKVMARQREFELVRAALASRIEVALRTDDLPQDPGLVQEFRITIRGQDVELLLEGSSD